MKSSGKPLDTARGLAPYASRLLNSQEVQENLLRGVRSTRDAYGRARGKSVVQATQDKKVRGPLKEAVRAAVQVWSGVSEPPKKRKPHLARKAVGLAVAGVGFALALNGDVRARALGLVGLHQPPSTDLAHPAAGSDDVR